MAGTTYQELLDGVANYYGSGSDQWAEIARYGVNQETIPIIQQVPGVTVTVSNSGKYLGYDYNKPFASVANPSSAIDSNTQTGAYGSGSFNAQLPATAVTDSSTGTTTLQSGAKTVSTGSTVATIADRASLAFVGVSLGTKLGKLIDSSIYSADPDWWDEHYPSINPQTWDDVATTQGGKNFIRAIFGLENDDATMYLDERMLAYTYMMLLQAGAYDTGEISATLPTTPGVDVSNIPQPLLLMAPTNLILLGVNGAYREYSSNGAEYIVLDQPANGSSLVLGFYSLNPFTVTEKISPDDAGVTRTPNSSTTLLNTPFYVLELSLTGSAFYNSWGHYGLPYNIINRTSSNYNRMQIATIIFDGTVTESGGGIEGIQDNPEATSYINPDTLINPTTGEPVTPNDNIVDVLQALKNLYPDFFNGSIYEDLPQADGTTQRITYIPVPYPDITTNQQPITDTTPGINPQTTPEVNSNTRTAELLQQLTDTLTDEPTAPDTGTGETPVVIIPTGSANALYSIYNPTQGELNNFGAWLWSSNFVDQLLKLFNDPMQAIIGLHKVFAQPAISGTSTIKVGYLDSGVTSNVVGNQYTTIDCGSVNVSEYFGNVFDYDPFTQIYIYLPFVGIEKLDTGDVMRGNVGVKYHVDVLTGACLAEITVTRDGAGGILYTFAGNCAVQYPISSGSYMGIVASLASIAGGVVGTIASGGALAPVAMGAVSGIMNAHTRVNHSGAFSGNAGAMGVKSPYLIITRPQTCLADNFPNFDGYPANKTTTLSECSGFVKCETCHIENVPATDAELSEIEMLLKGGIII